MAAKKIRVPAAPGFAVNKVTLEEGDKFISVKDGMALTTFSEPSIRRKLGDGTLRRFKAGRKTLLLYSDCLALVRETTRPSQS